MVGFQTKRYAHNFLRTAESFLHGASVDYRTGTVILPDGHVARVRAYPISIDVEATRRVAATPRTRRRAEQLLAEARGPIVVRVDRLEPSKNILRGFAAFEALLQRNPRYRGKVTFLAFLVPSRTGLREYGHYARQVQATIDRINARFSRAGHRPIRIFYENDYAQALAGLIGGRCRARQPARGRHEPGGQGGGARERPQRGDRAVRDTPAHSTRWPMASSRWRRRTSSAPPTRWRRARDGGGRADARLDRLRAGVEREDIAWWLRRQLTDLAEIVERR